MEEVEVTSDFIGSHSYKDDIAALLSEIDSSENQVKNLKLHVVEKENFLESLVKREDIVQADLTADKLAVNDLASHIKSLKARVERMKREKQLRLLEAQFHQYAAAASKLKGQADELSTVKNALFNKMQYLNDIIKPLQEEENTNMRLSINSGTDQLLPPDMFKSKLSCFFLLGSLLLNRVIFVSLHPFTLSYLVTPLH